MYMYQVCAEDVFMLFSDAVEEPVKNPQSAPVENPV